MEPLLPEQAEFLLSMALPTLRNEHHLTRKVMDAIPADANDYRPDPVAKSCLELAWHIAAAESRFLAAVAAGSFGEGGGRPESIRSVADVSAWYAEMFQNNFEKISQVSGDDLAKTIDFRGVFQLPAVMYLQFALHHTIHHRGQLSTYLRPTGAKVPSIYGESFDDAEARKLKEA
jgi:uncharacterized damage-inducible protein DinB